MEERVVSNMGTFINDLGINTIEMFKVTHCFCPLGGAYCTYNVTVKVIPDKVIPDYMDIEEYFKTYIDGKTYTIEHAASTIRDFINNEYEPCYVGVTIECHDAAHMPVKVFTRVAKNIVDEESEI